MVKKRTKIHDYGYKLLFSNKTFVKHLFNSFVGEKWVKQIDFQKLERVETSFISEEFREKECDALYKASCKDQEAYIFILTVTDGQAYFTRHIYECICHALEKPIPGSTVSLSVLKGLARVGVGIGVMCKRRFMFDADALSKLTGSTAYSSAKTQRELGLSPKWTLGKALPSIVKPYTYR